MIKTPNNPIQNTFLLNNIYKIRPSIGIILQNIGCCQLAFEIIQESYAFLEKTNKLELLYFTEYWEKPCLTPPTAIYETSSLIGYRGHIIATSVDGIVDATRAATIQKKLLWYIFDPFEIFQYDKDNIALLLSDKNIIKICRTQSYAKVLKEMYDGAKIEDYSMATFDIAKFAQILTGKIYAH